jgi:hypothetical protein
MIPLSGKDLSDARIELANADFSEYLDSLEVVLPTDAHPDAGRGLLGQHPFVEFDKFTAGEKRIAGLLTSPTGVTYSFSETTAAIGTYAYRNNGELPTDGLHLSRLLTEQGYAQYGSLSEQQRADTYLRCINLVTGKFYDSFLSAQWSPGGLYVEAVPEDLIREQAWNIRDKHTKGLPKMWRAKVYGEKPGTVLHEFRFGINNELIDPTMPDTRLPPVIIDMGSEEMESPESREK